MVSFLDPPAFQTGTFVIKLTTIIYSIIVYIMLAIIPSLLYVVSAQTSSTLYVYSRTYLRGLKTLENERIQADFINRGITYIEESVFAAAKQGLVKYKTEPFEGCESYTRPNELAPFGLDKGVCENIVNGIHALVSERFPDSDIIYDANTKQYILKWE